MVYYNPNEEELFPILYDVEIAFKIIDNYIDENLQFPDYPISSEKEKEIAQKRQGLMDLKNYILIHQFDMKMIDIIDAYVCKMWNQLVETEPYSEARQLFYNMYKAAEEIIGLFL